MKKLKILIAVSVFVLSLLGPTIKTEAYRIYIYSYGDCFLSGGTCLNDVVIIG